ncbi:putative AMP-binding enzyme [Colletotrichum sublineola]|uniref:Putative AMP-binding enzyme n=1 Tax=Colletotrichum sublineola TaxID=1173701 RepID=A0A066XHV8_COLSU|nr:putative AMP-binding enzyme [Colletotrichum sublineola]
MTAAGSVALSEAHGPPLDPSAIPDVWDGFQSAVRDHAEELALVCAHQPDCLFGFPSLPSPGSGDSSVGDHEPAYLRWTFGTLAQAIQQLVFGLHSTLGDGGSEGVVFETPVVTFLQNGADFVLAAWASIAMGGTLIPLNPMNLKNRDEVAHMLKTALSLSTQGQRPSLVYAADLNVAQDVDELGSDVLGPRAIKILASGSGPRAGWLRVEDLIKAPSLSRDFNQEIPLSSLSGDGPEKSGIVLFTSGSTSRPKGLFCRHSVLNTFTNTRLLHSPRHVLPQPGSRICSILPNNHGNGWTCIQTAHGRGAALVFPGPSFSTPESLLSTFHRESITHTMLVPALVHALAAAVERDQRPLKSLISVTFGGAILTKNEVLMAIQTLGAESVENAYGSTEGVVTSTGSMSVSALDSQKSLSEGSPSDEVPVGKPPMGHGIKIVDPATGDIVPRNIAGEIHGYGPMIYREGKWGYIGSEQHEAFYVEEETSRVWLRTGDMGRMDESGSLLVIGRYKDMIIRGGENISPAAIEAVLMRNNILGPLFPQVVGLRDAIAGEVPAVVIKGDQPGAAVGKTIRQTVLESMSKMHVPDLVVSLKEMGLDDFPKTNSGKIQKFKLKQLVADYLDERATSTQGGRDEDQVKAIWAAAIGLESPSQLDVDAPLGKLVDSITIMRVRDKIRRQTGVALPLAAMMQASTVAKQVRLLRSLSAGDNAVPVAAPANGACLLRQQERMSAAEDRFAARKAPPSGERMAHLVADRGLYDFTKDLVLKAISPHGFGWDDVEDIAPAYDANAVQAQCGFYDTINFNMAIVTRKASSKQELRTALEAAMLNHRIMCSFMVWDTAWRDQSATMKDALHVFVRPSARLFDLMIQDGGVLRSLKDLEEIALGNTSEAHRFPTPQQNTFPGPLYRVMLFDIEETGTVGMLTSGNHSISDHSAGQLFYDDLDHAVAVASSPSGSTAAAIFSQLPEHKDYVSYLDLNHALRGSPLALAAVNWHVDRLSSLPKHVDAGALWPSPATWMSVSLDDHYSNRHQLHHNFTLTAHRQIPGKSGRATPIPISTIVKASTALASAHRSGYTSTDAETGSVSRVAVFSSVEAARYHYSPFLPESFTAGRNKPSSLRWEAGDVAGPTVQIVCNVVQVPVQSPQRGETLPTVSLFLDKMQEEQELQTRQACAPWRSIMDGLDDPNASARPWPLLPLVHGTLMFNWAPGLGEARASSSFSAEDTRLSQFDNIETLNSVQKPRVGLVVTAGASTHRGPGKSSAATVFLHLRGAGLEWDNPGGMGSFAKEVEEIAQWLSATENQGRPIHEVFARH